MNLEEAEQLVEEKVEQYSDKESWALWAPFGTAAQLRDQQSPFAREAKVKEVQIRGDHEIQNPQVLPVDVEMCTGEDRVLEDPPLALVQQLIEPTMLDGSDLDEAVGLGRTVRIRDKVFYEVEGVEYRFFLDAVEEPMRLSELRNLIEQARQGEFEMELNTNNELVFSRVPDKGTEYTSERLGIDITEPVDELDMEQAIEHLKPEQRLAETALSAIGTQKETPIHERIERRVEPEEPAPMIDMEEDVPDPDASFETEEDEVQVGVKLVSLGRLYMETSMNDGEEDEDS